MKVVSWNVNGLRSCEGKGFLRWLRRSDADVVLLQEIKVQEHQLPRRLRSPRGFATAFHPATRPGYSGVAIYARRAPDEIRVGLGAREYDEEGRVITARFGDLAVVGTYVPNGGNECLRVPYKMAFSEALLAYLERLRGEGLLPIVGGDFNTAHRDIDLARPRENRKTSGFLPEECAWLDRFADHGFVDSFRLFHPEAIGHYSWWTFRAGARERNIGWRIDYLWVDRDLVSRVKAARIHRHVEGSDHCPVEVEIES